MKINNNNCSVVKYVSFKFLNLRELYFYKFGVWYSVKSQIVNDKINNHFCRISYIIIYVVLSDSRT